MGGSRVPHRREAFGTRKHKLKKLLRYLRCKRRRPGERLWRLSGDGWEDWCWWRQERPPPDNGWERVTPQVASHGSRRTFHGSTVGQRALPVMFAQRISAASRMCMETPSHQRSRRTGLMQPAEPSKSTTRRCGSRRSVSRRGRRELSTCEHVNLRTREPTSSGERFLSASRDLPYAAGRNSRTSNVSTIGRTVSST